MSFMGTKIGLFITDLRYEKVLKVELSSALYFRKISACYNSPYGFVSTSCTRSRIAITQLNPPKL